jgi:hypothetical protein
LTFDQAKKHARAMLADGIGVETNLAQTNRYLG